jgi:hypothetical protein
MATATIAHGQYPQRRPNGLWRGSSAMVMGLTGALSKGFLHGLNEIETTGLDRFVRLLESRQDPFQRQRGLITGMACPPKIIPYHTSRTNYDAHCLPSTVSNHISV